MLMYEPSVPYGASKSVLLTPPCVVCRQSGADYIVAPAGSVNDAAVTAAADAHGMVMVHTSTRLFHH